MDLRSQCAASVLAAAACAPAVPASAVAAVRTSPADLAARGVSVSWPIATNSAPVAPGTKIRLTYDRPRGRHRAVEVRVVRLSRKGRKLHTLRRKRLRHSGKVVVQLPRAVGRRYAVTVKSGPVRSRTILRTQVPLPQAAPAPAPAPVPAPTVTTAPVPLSEAAGPPVAAPTPMAPAPPAAPPAPAPPAPTCSLRDDLLDLRPPTAALYISRTPARAGESRSYEIENTSARRCVYGGGGYRWERYDGDRWFDRWVTVANSPLLPIVLPTIGIPAGTRWNGTVTVPSNAAPGRYRVTMLWYAANSLTAQIDVVN